MSFPRVFGLHHHLLDKPHHDGSYSRTPRPPPFNSSGWLVRILVGWLILLASFCRPVVSVTLPVTYPVSHPSSFLSLPKKDSHVGVTPNPSASRAAPMDISKVREEEVMYHLHKNGRQGVSYQRKASTVFLVELFNDLVRGLSPGSLARKARTGKPSPSRYNKALPFTDTIRSFSAGEVTFSAHNKATVLFTMPFLPPNERLKSAELRFLCHNGSGRRRSRTRYKLALAVYRGGKVVKKVVLRERALLQREYHVFDISQVLDTWINSYHGNITLQVRIPRKLETSIQMTNSSLTSTSLVALYLEDRDFLKNMYESYTTDDVQAKRSDDPDNDNIDLNDQPDHQNPESREKRGSTSRDKRGSNRRRSRNRQNKRWYRAPKHAKCGLYNFQVDFDFIGWGQWIIHPKDFNSRFCYGECPSPLERKYKPTNHAMLQTLMRQKKPRLAPPTCCVPTKLKPLSMLYFEYDEIVVRHHEDMIADECGCR